MSSKKLRVGIVGSGHMAGVHTRHWHSIGEIELSAVATHDPAQKIIGCEQLPVYHSLGDMLENEPSLDIIDICTPTHSHLGLALEAISSGKHLLIEKPVTRTLEECDLLIDAASESNSIVMVGHVVRFFPEFALVHDQIRDGSVGVPVAVRTARLMGKGRDGHQDWYGDPAKSGGIILDVMIHDFDWLLWSIGPIERVFANGVSLDKTGTGVDYALVTLDHKNGALSHVTGSRTHPSFRTTIEVCGDAGMLEHDSAKTPSLTIFTRQGAGTQSLSPMASVDDPYYKELRHFTDCVINDSQPSVTLSDARAALQVSLAALESIETGMPVEL